MSLTATYDAALSRVRLTATGLAGSPAWAVIARSTDLAQWTVVRGGASVPVSAGTVALDDYEFVNGQTNHYRVTALNGAFAIVDEETATVLPELAQVWLKSISRPYLNRPVVVQDYSEVQRPARASAFQVVGRTLPVAVTDVAGSRRWTLDLLTDTLADAATLDFILAAGDIMFVHAPAWSGVPGGYVIVGDTTQRRTARRTTRRITSLPCTEVATPGPDVVGATVTWADVTTTYSTWALVGSAHPTWADLLQLVGDPEDVIVP
ncbi:hypothetical protein ACIBF5_09485 [Micromonospora sp. NPDC050417]|uniref:hypothetical protein n=1 Tax=Micromonospora sp. NPDC050417 TaxID=3364280 RepID=UPI0037A60B77